MSAPPMSVYLVLSLGAFSGGVVKGLTGFGNAIINLLVWVTFTAAGVNGGPLQVAVLADSLGCVTCAVPLLVMTAAHKTADWRLVVTIFAFTTAGAPLGAALLTGLNPRWVELVMACVLLLVIGLHVKLHEKLASAVRRCRDKHRSDPYGLVDGNAACITVSDEPRSPAAAGALKADASLQCIAVDSLPSPVQGRTPSVPCEASLPLIADDPESINEHQAAPICDRMAETTGVKGTFAHAGQLDSAGRPSSSTSGIVLVTAYCMASPSSSVLSNHKGIENTGMTVGCACLKPCGGACAEESDLRGCNADEKPLLGDGAIASDAIAPSSSSSDRLDGGDGSGTGALTGATARSCGDGGGAEYTGTRVMGRLRSWIARQDWPAMRRILAIGSIAGFIAGIMGGMTGIGGPPIMFMYEKLKVAKEVVRGTNAVTNVLQVKIIFYFTMGIFQRTDAPLFAVTSVVGLSGVAIGNLLAGRVDQKGFSRIMVALMVVCCALLFLSAAGLKGHGA